MLPIEIYEKIAINLPYQDIINFLSISQSLNIYLCQSQSRIKKIANLIISTGNSNVLYNIIIKKIFGYRIRKTDNINYVVPIMNCLLCNSDLKLIKIRHLNRWCVYHEQSELLIKILFDNRTRFQFRRQSIMLTATLGKISIFDSLLNNFNFSPKHIYDSVEVALKYDHFEFAKHVLKFMFKTNEKIDMEAVTKLIKRDNSVMLPFIVEELSIDLSFEKTLIYNIAKYSEDIAILNKYRNNPDIIRKLFISAMKINTYYDNTSFIIKLI